MIKNNFINKMFDCNIHVYIKNNFINKMLDCDIHLYINKYYLINKLCIKHT